MPVELAVAQPVFLDLTFVDLEGLPAPGEERFAADLVRSPGGGAIIAVGAARLGLSVAVAAPLGPDLAGDLVRQALQAEGIDMVDRECSRTPTTVVLPVDGERAMVTVDHGIRARKSDIAPLAPRAVSASLDQIHCVPDGAHGYITCGDDDARAYAGRPPAELQGVRALFVNHREAVELTGAGAPDEAAEELARSAQTVVVTRGAEGLFAIADGHRIDVPGVDVGAPVDTTGAGDLLVSAYVWADLRGAPVEERLRWAVLYASLSVTTPTAVGGAVTEERLVDEGVRHGLTAPAA